MKKIFIYILLVFIFSCNQKVEPTVENLNSIVNSKEYSIEIKLIRGNIAGLSRYNEEININNDSLAFNQANNRFVKKINSEIKDSLEVILKDLVSKHNKNKAHITNGGCMTRDENYLLKNDSITIEITPQSNNIYIRLKELIEPKIEYLNLDYLTIESIDSTKNILKEVLQN